MKLATLGLICVFGVGYSAPQRNFNRKAAQFAKKNNPLDEENTQLAKDVSKQEYNEALDRVNGLFQKGLTAGLKALDAEQLAKTVIDTYGDKVADAVNNAGESAVEAGKLRINDATKQYKKEINYAKNVKFNKAINDASKLAQNQINTHLENGKYGFALGALKQPAESLRKLAVKKVQDTLPKNLGNRKVLAHSKRVAVVKYNKDYKPAVNQKVGEQLNKIQANNNQ